MYAKMAQQEKKKLNAPPKWFRFVQGGLAAMAGATASHPLDLIKVRLQVQGEKGSTIRLGTFQMGRSIFSSDGFSGLYNGLSASLLRQAVYSGVRFGAYDTIKDAMGEKPGVRELNVFEKIGAGLAAGGIGAFFATPTDVTLVRMQADGKLPVELRRNYKNVFDGLFHITKEEGFIALYRGCTPTVIRAMIVTAAQFAAYDQVKGTLISYGAKDDPITHLGSSFIASFFAAAASNPVDVVKTRLMNSGAGEGQVQYSGVAECVSKTMRQEGPLAFYKGFVPTLIRTGPYMVVMFLTLEQLKQIRW